MLPTPTTNHPLDTRLLQTDYHYRKLHLACQSLEADLAQLQRQPAADALARDTMRHLKKAKLRLHDAMAYIELQHKLAPQH